MNVNKVDLILNEIEEAMKLIAKKHDLKYNRGSGSYGFDSVSTKVEFKENTEYSNSLYNIYFEDIAGYDKSKSAIGATVILDFGKVGKVLDYKSRNRANPVIVLIDEKTYRIPMRSIRNMRY